MDIADIRSKSVEELNEELIALRREQFNLRMQSSSGEMTEHHQHSVVRKNIARVKTVLNELARSAGESK
jgi:large subunit ribosomal protein L29